MTPQTKQVIHEALNDMYNNLDYLDRLNDMEFLIIDAQRELGFKDWAKEKENDIESERGYKS